MRRLPFPNPQGSNFHGLPPACVRFLPEPHTFRSMRFRKPTGFALCLGSLFTQTPHFPKCEVPETYRICSLLASALYPNPTLSEVWGSGNLLDSLFAWVRTLPKPHTFRSVRFRKLVGYRLCLGPLFTQTPHFPKCGVPETYWICSLLARLCEISRSTGKFASFAFILFHSRLNLSNLPWFLT